MGEPVRGKATVPLEDVVLAQTFELEALMTVLERHGLLQRAEPLEEIKRLKKKAQAPTGGRPPRSA